VRHLAQKQLGRSALSVVPTCARTAGLEYHGLIGTRPVRMTPIQPSRAATENISTWRFLTLVALGALLPFVTLAHGISEEERQRMLDSGYVQYVWLGVVFFLTSVRDIVTFVTVFTIGHFITLILATFLTITWNFWPVDALIAVSMIYKGFDNLGGFQKHFSMASPSLLKMVFAFGLLHGFGLSTRLQRLPLGDDPAQMLVRILSFNVGVELGQVEALVVMLGALALWRQTASFARFSYAANRGLVAAGVHLLFAHLHGYQHDVNGESFRLPVEEHRHIHMDLRK